MNDPTNNPTTASLQRLQFSFDGEPLTIILWDGEPYCFLAEVEARLGYRRGRLRDYITNTKRWGSEFHEGAHVRTVAGDDLRLLKATIPRGGGRWLSERAGSTTLLSELGLYLVIAKTHKPEGIRLRAFVVDHVLPQIARDGSFLPHRVVVNGAIVDRDVKPDKIDEEPVNGARLHVEHGRLVGYDLDPPNAAQALRELRDRLDSDDVVPVSVQHDVAIAYTEQATGLDLSDVRVAVKRAYLPDHDLPERLAGWQGEETRSPVRDFDDEPTVERHAPAAVQRANAANEATYRGLRELLALGEPRTRSQLVKALGCPRWTLFQLINEGLDLGEFVELNNPNGEAMLIALANCPDQPEVH